LEKNILEVKRGLEANHVDMQLRESKGQDQLGHGFLII